MRQRLQDDTHDPYDYPDDPYTTDEAISGGIMIMFIGGIVFSILACVIYVSLSLFDDVRKENIKKKYSNERAFQKR